MSNKLYDEASVQAIADAIRNKNGSQSTYKVSEMAAAVEAIPTGSTPVIEAKSITENGTYTAPSGVDGFSPVTVNVPSSSGIKVTSISRYSQPTKTTYKAGESMDLSGFAVTVTYSNGATRIVAYNNYPAFFSFSPLIFSAGNTSCTVKFSEDGYSATYSQSVTVTNYVESIAITTMPTKTSYIITESIDLSGMVLTGTRSNGATVALTGYTYTPTTADVSGTQSITISYVSDSGKTLTTSFNVAVSDVENPLSSIAITTPATKLSYTSGEAFNTTGMIITATFEDGSTSVVDNSKLTITPARLKTTDTSVEISYYYYGRTRTVTQSGVTVTGSDIDAVLNNNTWAAIASVDTEGANYWSVGDVKMTTLNGTACGVTFSNTQLGLFILGFNHNSDIEGTGITFGMFKTALTNGVDVCIQSSSGGTSMNTSSTSSGGWKNCAMRYTKLGSTDTQNGDASSATATNPISGTLMACLEEDLRAVMRPMTIYSDNIGGGDSSASNVTATVDYLPLLAEFEIHGTRTYANSAEQNYQKRYDYYTAGNSAVKYKSQAASSVAWWWCRSVWSSDGYNFCAVSSRGGADWHGANITGGVSAALRV